MINLSYVYQSFLDLLYPPDVKCIICQGREDVKRGVGLCIPCYNDLSLIEQPAIPEYYIKYRACTKIFSVCRYTASAKDLIYRYKYKGEKHLAVNLGWMMYQRAVQHLTRDGVDFVTAVPLHLSRKRQRGFNQSRLLAVRIGYLLEKPVHYNLISRVKDTPTQTALNGEQRRENVADAFKISASLDLTGKNVLLVDDVCTTGATLNSCGKTIIRAGASRVYGITFAAGSGY